MLVEYDRILLSCQMLQTTGRIDALPNDIHAPRDVSGGVNQQIAALVKASRLGWISLPPFLLLIHDIGL